MSGNEKVIPVKVALRIRPLVSKEKAEACVECLRTVPGEPQVILGKDKAFTYDHVFAPSSPQIEVYESSVQPLLNALFKGYNATVLAYGQTGSGKTYSMGSGYLSLYNALNNENISAFNINDLDDVGIIPRVLTDLFTRIEEEQRQKGTKFFISVSFVEVYNEEIKDLFNSKLNAEPLNIREENSSIRVVNLSEIEVSDAITTLRLLEKGSSLRVVGGTAMNDQSSRSHAIFTINMEQRPADSVGSDSSEATITRSKFHLVDLAGSERQSKTKAEGLRLKEGININLGLLALGNVISILGEDNPKHVPYRESKLTRLLQDSLGGNSHTVMLACVSPADSNLEETLNTLRYADRARKIKNKPIVNIDPQTAEVMRLRQENQELKSKLIQATGGAGLINVDFADSSKEIYLLREELEKVKAENLKLVREIQFATQNNLRYYEKLEKTMEEKEQCKKRYEEIKQMFEKLVKKSQETVNLEASVNSSNSNDASSLTLNQTYSEKQTLINELQSKLNEFDELKVKEEKAASSVTAAEQDDAEISPNEPVDKEYVMRQARMQFQLTEYDAELAKKELLFQKMRENNYEDQLLRSSSNMQDLRAKIDSLEKEKEDLLDALRSNEATSRKAADQKRDRLKQLELEALDLKRKEKEHARMIKLKEENEKHCERLRAEIVHIKQERVKLLKQIRSDADAFRKFRAEKEKEVTSLKALDRKRQVEIHKLQEGNTKQDAVLRRKNEEISRMQKQVREMVEKQKQVAEKRLQAFERKDSSLLGDKLRGWITQELDLSVNIAETRILLTQLIDERKEANSELTRLNKERNDLIELNSNMNKQSVSGNNKRKLVDMDCTYVAGASSNSTMASDDPEEVERNNAIAELDSRILRLEEEIECKSIQITEIQQTVIDGDQEDRTKHIFNNVHGLMEAKVLLKHLYYTGVTALLESKQVKTQHESSINSLTNELKDLKKKYEQMDEEFKTTKRSLKKEISDLTLYYEQRVLMEIKQVLENLSYTQDDRVNRLYEQILASEKRLDDELSTLANEGTFGSASSLAGPRTSGLKKTFLLNSENRLNNEFKKAAKINREHRRTRVLPQHHRAKIVLPEIDVNLVDITNNNNNSSIETPCSVNNTSGTGSMFPASSNHLSTTTTGSRHRTHSPMDTTICKPASTSSVSFLSPMASSGNNSSGLLSDIEATPDDTNKDPDWTKTPIHFKRPKRTSVRNRL